MQFMKLEGQPILRLPEAMEKPKKKEWHSNKRLHRIADKSGSRWATALGTMYVKESV
jgi:hypothetical protein